MLPTKDKKYGVVAKTPNGEFENDLVHIYICSYDEIKIGDYVYSNLFNTIQYIGDERLLNESNGHCKKIIATTDKSQNLPEIPEQFLKEFCDNGGIWEVEVEYEEIAKCLNYPIENCPFYECSFKKCDDCESYFYPKLTNNTISIRYTKQTLTRDEVERLCKEAFNLGKTDIINDINTWLKQNIN